MPVPSFLVNPWEADGSLADLHQYPRLCNYFEKHADRLKKRYVAKKPPGAWYRTIDKDPGAAFCRRASSCCRIWGWRRSPSFRASTRITAKDDGPPDDWDWRCSPEFLMSEAVRRFIDALGVKMREVRCARLQYLRCSYLPDYRKIQRKSKDGLRTAFGQSDKNVQMNFLRGFLRYEPRTQGGRPSYVRQTEGRPNRNRPNKESMTKATVPALRRGSHFAEAAELIRKTSSADAASRRMPFVFRQVRELPGWFDPQVGTSSPITATVSSRRLS